MRQAGASLAILQIIAGERFMHMDLNKIQLIGRLTADPDVRVAEGRTPRAVVRFATNRVWKDAKSGQTHREVEFHALVMFGKLALVAQKHLKRADRLYVQGRVQTVQLTGKNGRRTSRVEVIAENIIMLGGAKAKEGNDSVVQEEIETENGAGV